jgi:aromatic-L-amino-acid decarboxylase
MDPMSMHESRSKASPALQLGDDRRRTLDLAIDALQRAWESFDEPRENQPTPSSVVLDATTSALPDDPTSISEVLSLAEDILDASLAQTRPRFFAFVGSSGLEAAVLGDLLASAHDVNMATTAYAADLIEAQTVSWLADLIGYSAAEGYFTSGGMVSNLTALSAAREHSAPGTRISGVGDTSFAVYTSVESHASIERAAEVLGLGRNSVRAIPIDEHRRMRVDALKESLAADLSCGMVPMAVVATAGTTLTGAVDDLKSIAEICKEFDTWMHVDGAYGLAAAAAPETSHLFAGLNEADSVSIDAHKWLFVPKACGCIMVKNKEVLTAAFAHESGYMLHDEQRAVHSVDRTLEYSRPFRALKLWVALKTHGRKQYEAAISTNLSLAQRLASVVDANDRLELMVDPQLSIVPYRYLTEHHEPNAFNQLLVKKMQERGRVWVSDAVINGQVCLRPCIVNFRTQAEDIQALIDETLEVAKSLDNPATD